VFRQGERLFAVRPEKIMLVAGSGSSAIEGNTPVLTAGNSAEEIAVAVSGFADASGVPHSGVRATSGNAGETAQTLSTAPAAVAAPAAVVAPSAAPAASASAASVPPARAAKKRGAVETVVFVGNMLKLWIRIAPEDTLVLAYCPADSAGTDAGPCATGATADPATAWRRGTPVGLTWAEQDEVTLTS
jgi:hypothetical protein